MAISKFAEIKDRIFYLQNEDGPTLPQSARKPFSDLPRITENLGVAAIAPVISGRRSISLDGNPAKIKSLPLRWIFIPSVLAIVFLATLFTWRVDQELIRLEQDSKAFQTNVEQLNKRLEPIEQNRALLKEAQETMKDVNDFLKTKPRLFRHINDIARLVPENTWFTNLSFKDGVITLQGESKDALKVIEILREAGLFAQVRLSGSVSRLKTGVERFTFSVKLKDQESDTLENRENVKENHFGNT